MKSIDELNHGLSDWNYLIEMEYCKFKPFYDPFEILSKI